MRKTDDHHYGVSGESNKHLFSQPASPVDEHAALFPERSEDDMLTIPIDTASKSAPSVWRPTTLHRHRDSDADGSGANSAVNNDRWNIDTNLSPLPAYSSSNSSVTKRAGHHHTDSSGSQISYFPGSRGRDEPETPDDSRALVGDAFPPSSTGRHGITKETNLLSQSQSHQSLGEPLAERRWYLRFGRFWILWRNKKDIHLTLYSLCYLITCLFIVCLANATTDRENVDNPAPPGGHKQLPDFIMSQTKDWYMASSMSPTLSDTLVVTSLLLFLLRALTMGQRTLMVIRRTFYTVACLYLLRAACVTMTILPNPLEECHLHINRNLFLDAVDIFIGRKVSCSDVFFSGHSIIYSVPMLAWVTYSKPAFGLPFHPIPPLVVSHAFFAYLSLIMSRYHYTIDVAIALVLSLFIWILLHLTWTNNEMQKYWVCRLLKKLDDHTMKEEQLPISTATETSSTSLIPHRIPPRQEMSMV